MAIHHWGDRDIAMGRCQRYGGPKCASDYVYNRDYERSDQALVLDLDKALLSSFDFEDKYALMDTLTLTRHGAVSEFVVIPTWNRITHFRPHCVEFLDYAQFRFKTKVVWSAGGKENVDLHVKALTSRSCIRFDLVLTKEDTKFTKEQPMGVKNLYNVFAMLDSCRLENTFLVDDQRSNFLQTPMNGIVIPEFNPTDPSKLSVDSDLMILKEWFSMDDVVNCEDVTTLDKDSIFTRFKRGSAYHNSGRMMS